MTFGVPRYLMTDDGSHFIHGAFRKCCVCDGEDIKHDSDQSCVCDVWHMVGPYELFAMKDTSNMVQILVACAMWGIQFSSINCLR